MEMQTRKINSPRLGEITVHLQGDLKQKSFCIMTVHDLGCNHSMWKNFLEGPEMSEINRRALYIHIDVPGQEDNAENLPPDFTFPTMQDLGQDLICVLDKLEINQVIGLGEGAGANILARFALSHPSRCRGVCLIHCTGTTAGFMESVKDKLIGWKLEHIGMNPTAEHYLVLHRFGSCEVDKAENQEQLNKVLSSFQESLRKHINPHNLNRFVQSFMKRTNVTDKLQNLKCPTLLVTGSNASFNHTVHRLAEQMQQKMKKNLFESLEVQGVANVLVEKPEKLAEAFLYFCQGLGFVVGAPMPRVHRTSSQDGPDDFITRKTRSMSMEEADKPLGIYSSSPSKFGTPPKVGSPPRAGFGGSPTK